MERSRKLYGMLVHGFVVMPEHVYLLVSEPERGTVANAIQSLKICSAKRAKSHISQTKGNMGQPFWQKRYYDRNVRGKEFTEKLKYIHRNPVRRGPGGAGRRLGMEQLSALPHRGGLWCGNRILEEQNVQLCHQLGSHISQLMGNVGHPSNYCVPSIVNRQMRDVRPC